MPIQEATEGTALNSVLLENVLPYLVAIRDAIFQFELMTIKGDYEKVSLGGDHLSRENLRVKILLKRLDVGLSTTYQYKQEPAVYY